MSRLPITYRNLYPSWKAKVSPTPSKAPTVTTCVAVMCEFNSNHNYWDVVFQLLFFLFYYILLHFQMLFRMSSVFICSLVEHEIHAQQKLNFLGPISSFKLLDSLICKVGLSPVLSPHFTFMQLCNVCRKQHSREVSGHLVRFSG